MHHPNLQLSQSLLKLVAEIDEFKGRWEALKTLTPDRLQALKQVATIESVGSSTRIEGATLSDAEIETLLSNLTATAFKTRDTQEVAGYAEAMDLVFQAFEDLRPTENHICQLHQLLLKHSEKDERHRGQYKTLDNHVVARDKAGKVVTVVFETASPFEAPQKMEALCRWVDKVAFEDSMHPLLTIAVFIVSFLAIHPFQNGNGRLSRVLTTLLLLRAGYAYVPYASLEQVIEENKDLYYKALRRTQVTLNNKEPDWEPWLGFFLRCLKKQKDVLEKRIIHEREATQSQQHLSSLSLQVLRLFETHPRLTIAEIVVHTGANQNTLKVRLRELVNSGHLQRFGKARATWYQKAP